MSNLKKKKILLAGLTGLAVFLMLTPSASAASKKKSAGSDPYGINKILKKLMAKKKVSPKQHVQLDIFFEATEPKSAY